MAILVWEREGVKTHQAAGQGRTETGFTESMHYFSARPPFRYQLTCIFSLRVHTSTKRYVQDVYWLILIDSLRNLLRPAMAINGHRAQPIVVDNVQWWIACTTYCGRQWPLMDTFSDLLWWTLSIDWQYPKSIVTTIDYCCRVSNSIADKIHR